MLSQIRQISDGNSNTVFVKNKEQKFNLDKEIHDLECWKQSRNHVYRKEERELLAHLDKLRHQQEYLHHLDEERGLYPRAVSTPHRGHREKESQQSSRHNISVPPLDKDNPELSLKLNLQSDLPNKAQPLSNTNVASLPPVRSSTDKKTLHRTDAHTNICVVCQLPRRSFTKHGHHYSTEEVCCCDHQHEELKTRDRRSTVGGYEEYSQARQTPIQVGQRRHSLMMARLNDEKYEHQPHPPDRSQRSHSRRSQEKMDSNKRNNKDHDHTRHHIGHVHNHHGNEHDHHGHMHYHHEHVIDNHGHVRHHHSHVHDHHGHAHDHHRNKHDGHDHHGHVHDHHGHVTDNHGHVRHNGAMLDYHGYGHDHHRHKDHHGINGHHGNAHHYGNDTRHSDYSVLGPSIGNAHHRHSHYGNQATNVTHTPCNSPHRSSRHSLSHQNSHDPLYSAPFSAGHQYHSKRSSDAGSHFPGSLGTGVQDSGYDARRRDHELHWDRHQVCKLRGMITDPHYKEQLDVDNKNTYPWSSQQQANKASSVDIQDLKNCRYLRFSKINLENMKENPEEEVEVFEKKYSPT